MPHPSLPPAPLIVLWGRIKKLLDTVLPVEFYKKEMADGVCSIILSSKRHLQVHLRKVGLISEAEISLHLSRSDFTLLAQALHLVAVLGTPSPFQKVAKLGRDSGPSSQLLHPPTPQQQ